MTDRSFEAWFEQVCGVPPRLWQARLANDQSCASRLIRVPTGLGKTLGVLGAWAYHRVERRDQAWPRRLVLVMPMRVLVEQCESEVRRVLKATGRLAESDAQLRDLDKVGVHVLMGGADQTPWHLHPEHDAVLIGTQDMLLSRALNRGYASPRARWPMEYGLLHQDSLWVLDEVQLMGVGLATTAQLQAFRDALEIKALRPAKSWWMSATLQVGWFEKSAFRDRLEQLESTAVSVPAAERSGGPFDANKSLDVIEIGRADDAKLTRWGSMVVEAHRAAPNSDYGRITLAICNTVDDAVELHGAIRKALGKSADTDLRLVHSRFRGLERAVWREAFLSRAACTASVDRIIVATQVVEAGVDVSASALVTQLAPWPSLVQRFGRAARYGGSARVVVVDREVDDKSAAPYELSELNAAKAALARLKSVDLGALESLEGELREADPELLSRLYPYEPLHVLTRREHDELFDTEPDLTGTDLDISRFIREGDERDVLVWWWPVKRNDPEALPTRDLQPGRNDLCRVPVTKAKPWLDKVREDRAAWVWDYLEGKYLPIHLSRVYPGQTVLVDADWGGYDVETGFTGDKRGAKGAPVPHAAEAELSLETAAELAQDDESLSELQYRTIATHGKEAAERAEALARQLGLEGVAGLLRLAALAHDWGKAHPVFQAAIVADGRPTRNDLAKAPSAAWRKPPYENRQDAALHRPGFRHELASALMLFELLRSADSRHEALLGPHVGLRDAGLVDFAEVEKPIPREGLVRVLSGLTAIEVDLIAYLILAHHGKVRTALRATPDDQKRTRRGHAPLRGVVDGDRIPGTLVWNGTELTSLPEVTLSLALAEMGVSGRYGDSWTERVARLLSVYGPHSLALLETLLRVADVRASIECTEADVVLASGVKE